MTVLEFVDREGNLMAGSASSFMLSKMFTLNNFIGANVKHQRNGPLSNKLPTRE